MEKEEENSATIQVKDKRRFNQDGTLRNDLSADSVGCADFQDPQKDADSTESEKEFKKGVTAEAESQGRSPPFEINFTTFTLSLASSVQISLGLIPHPATGKGEVDLESAKQTIDILGMLEEKTKGNLDKNEGQILKQILFELRMQYVERTKGK